MSSRRLTGVYRGRLRGIARCELESGWWSCGTAAWLGFVDVCTRENCGLSRYEGYWCGGGCYDRVQYCIGNGKTLLGNITSRPHSSREKREDNESEDRFTYSSSKLELPTHLLHLCRAGSGAMPRKPRSKLKLSNSLWRSKH